MDVYTFIKSDAIRRHCQEIHHSFTPLQTAYLINNSHELTLAEKHKAFQWMMETMPDEEIGFPRGLSMKHSRNSRKMSLRYFLKEYISLQNMCLHEFFCAQKNCIYEWSYNDLIKWGEDKYYQTVEDALSDVDVDTVPDRTAGGFIVRKSEIDGKQRRISTCFNFNKEVTDIYMASGLSYEEDDIMDRLDQVCFICPTPFKKGDIVYAPKCYWPGTHISPFVFERTWFENISEESKKKLSASGDSSDMTAYGYFQNEDGRIFYECMHDYLSLEYYTGRLDGSKRILKAVSSFMKEEINLELLVNAYHIIMNETYTNEIRKYLNITDEGLRLAGLLD